MIRPVDFGQSLEGWQLRSESLPIIERSDVFRDDPAGEFVFQRGEERLGKSIVPNTRSAPPRTGDAVTLKVDVELGASRHPGPCRPG